MGKRLLRASILRPLIDPEEIQRRYEAVAAAKEDLMRRERIRQTLGGILDLERLLARISLDSAGPRDVLGAGRFAEASARIESRDSRRCKASCGRPRTMGSIRWKTCAPPLLHADARASGDVG